ncbi:MAG: PAS domain S-box protein [Guyparkeria sp.]|uniref:PAS domain S-box protein n=1 Tax=Guyparkeria sp. TaxID=2035736 RepID=UPI00397D770D
MTRARFGKSFCQRVRQGLPALFVFLLGLPWGLASAAAEPMVLGVLAVRPAAVMQERYEPLAEHLDRTIADRDVELRILSREALDDALQRNAIDLLLTSPTHYEIVRSENALSGVLATQISRYGEQQTRSLGSAIIARADSDDIETLADLDGRRIASPGTCCLAGYQAPLREALDVGVDLRERADFHFVDDHDAVIDAVLAGDAEVGFVRTGLLEALIDGGELAADALKLVEPQELGAFPYRVSTRLYPEWPLVTLAHVDAETERRIAAALFGFQPDEAVVRQTGLAGFGPPADYLTVERLTRSLGLPPFEGADRITWRQLWAQYRVEAVILGVSAALVLLLSLALLMRHLAVRRSEERFRRFFEDNDSAMLLVDFQGGTVLDANRAAARFYGWSRDELIDRPLADIWVEGNGAGGPLPEADREIYTARLRSGETRQVEAHATSMRGVGHGRKHFFVIIHDVTERVRAEAALAEERRRLANVIEGTATGTWEWNVQTGETHFNERWAEMLGYRLAELEPVSIATWEGLVHSDDLEKSNRMLEACFSGKAHYYDCEMRMCHRGGHWVWVLSRGRVLEWTGDGRPLRMWGTHQDISDRKRMEQDLQLAASVFVHAREAIMITDLDAHIVDVNAAFVRMTGWRRDEVIGRTPAFLRSGKQDAAFYRRMWQRLRHKGYWTGELWNRRKDGSLFAERLTVSLVRDADGHPSNYMALASDITDLKTYQKQLEHRASHDALTGLPNRVLMADRLRHAMAQTRRRGGVLAVVFLDLDGFKGVNDRYGHDMGDRLLIEVSKDFAAQLREVDTLARISGDEFVVVLGALTEPAAAEPVIARLVEAAARERVIDGKPVQVTASAGYSFYPQDEPVDDEDLLKQADTAMYAAKEAGRNRACPYRPDMVAG